MISEERMDSLRAKHAELEAEIEEEVHEERAGRGKEAWRRTEAPPLLRERGRHRGLPPSTRGGS